MLNTKDAKDMTKVTKGFFLILCALLCVPSVRGPNALRMFSLRAEQSINEPSV